MKKIKFRTIAPIFNIWDTEFELNGIWKDVEYNIRFIELTKKGTELDSFVDKKLANEIYKYIFFDSPFYIKGKDNCQILIIDVTQPLIEELKVAGNSAELVEIEHAIILALHLSSNVGICKKTSYTIRLSDNASETGQISNKGYGTFNSLSNPNFRFHSGSGVCVIKDYNFCIHLFDSLLKVSEKSENQATNLLDLAKNYFLTTFTLQHIEHAYLILMVVFEALFKEDESQNIHKAAKTLSILIAKDREERKEIQKAFTDNPNGFIDNRNKIAHGTLFEGKFIKEQYPILHGYIVSALNKIIDLVSTNKIGNDYYETLFDLTTKANRVDGSAHN